MSAPHFDDEAFLRRYQARHGQTSTADRYAVISDAWHELDYVAADSWLHAFERWLLEVRGWTGYDRFAGKSCPEEPYDKVRFGHDGVFHTALIVPAEALEGSDE
jgi:hypothetical protein